MLAIICWNGSADVATKRINAGQKQEEQLSYKIDVIREWDKSRLNHSEQDSRPGSLVKSLIVAKLRRN
jgi:hypothetical protein